MAITTTTTTNNSHDIYCSQQLYFDGDSFHQRSNTDLQTVWSSRSNVLFCFWGFVILIKLCIHGQPIGWRLSVAFTLSVC